MSTARGAGVPVVSVVIPVRNDATRLAIALSALRLSSFAAHEVIVVDDASTDASASVAEEMGARVERLPRRSGPAEARNRGAALARGRYLVFVDADVRVHADTLARAVDVFERDPTVDALFGSYDASPAAPGAVSQYKNLLHHHVHQTGRAEAGTFWAGCGAIRREVFLSAGGFAASAYARPSIEDIELGVRLTRAGRRVVLRPEIQATHLKAWTLRTLLVSDVADRAIPWARLVLAEGRMPDDLNLRAGQRASALLAYAMVACLVASPFWPPALALALAALGAIGILNRGLYAFFARRRGWRFLLVAVPMHLFYYLYSVAAFGIGLALHLAGR
jgi:glycosyltransferase involved in cell wall biosynthesis